MNHISTTNSNSRFESISKEFPAAQQQQLQRNKYSLTAVIKKWKGKAGLFERCALCFTSTEVSDILNVNVSKEILHNHMDHFMEYLVYLTKSRLGSDFKGRTRWNGLDGNRVKWRC